MGLTYNPRSVKAIGDEVRQLAQNCDDFTEVWPKVGNYLARQTRAQFATKGKRSGDGWKPLAPSTRAEKKRLGYPPATLVRTGELKEGLTGRPMDVEIYEPRRAVFGTRNPKAVWHHFGTFRNGKRHVPARKIIVLLPEDRDQIRDLMLKHLKKHA